MDDVAAMDLALNEAMQAGVDVPVGAVVVLDGHVIGRGHNAVEATGDPTLHAEMVALRQAVTSVGRADMARATLVVTLEPCPMCAGAAVLCRVGRVVYGCDDPKAGAVRSLYTLLSDSRLNHRCRVVAGVKADASSALLVRFFEGLRKRPPNLEGGGRDQER